MALERCPLLLAQNSQKKDIDHVADLGFERLVAPREIIREHRAVHEIAHSVDDPRNRHFAKPSSGNQVGIHLPPLPAVLLAVLEVSLLLAVAELSPLLDQQLDILRMIAEKRQVGVDRGRDPLERVGDRLIAGLHRLPQPIHSPRDGFEKQVFLAGKIAIDRPFADLEGVGNELHFGVLIAVLGEDRGGRVEDFIGASGPQRFVLGTTGTGFSGGFHG